MGSFHEMIGESTAFKALGDGSSVSGWFVFYVVVGLAGIFMMLFFLLKFLRNKVALLFAVLGVLLFLSNPIQENYEIASFRNAANPAYLEKAHVVFVVGGRIRVVWFFFLVLIVYDLFKKFFSKIHPERQIEGF
jgi:hypothetical protein